jgi:hypothetical protein
MRFDVRWPLGLLLACVGALLTGYGIVADPETFRPALGTNVDLWWGLVLLVIGGALLALARRANRRTPVIAPHPSRVRTPQDTADR